MIKHITILLLSIGLISSCSNPKEDQQESISAEIESPTNKVILSSEVVWEKLNPARGDQSPQAGTIWGDRKGIEATGFLAKFIDGFSSPPHIHNVTYRAVVIKGLVHNDDPKAENMWMQPGSFWTQPEGAAHITSAKGAENIALVEIDNGPYLVKHSEEAYKNGEKPINVDVTNIVWLDKEHSNWIVSKSNAQISFLSNNTPLKSLFVKLPKGYVGEIKSNGSVMHSVIISGALNYTMPLNREAKVLDPGSYFGATSKAVHSISNTGENEAIIYVRTNGEIKIK